MSDLKVVELSKKREEVEDNFHDVLDEMKACYGPDDVYASVTVIIAEDGTRRIDLFGGNSRTELLGLMVSAQNWLCMDEE